MIPLIRQFFVSLWQTISIFCRIVFLCLTVVFNLVGSLTIQAGRFCQWLSIQLWQITRNLFRGLGREWYRICFGNWIRTGITAAISGFVLASYFPNQFGEIYASCLTIALTLFSIRVIFHPYWPIKAFSPKKK